MSTAGVLRNGLASNVFVYTNTKVYVRERPSDPRDGLKKEALTLLQTPPRGVVIQRKDLLKITQHIHTQREKFIYFFWKR